MAETDLEFYSRRRREEGERALHAVSREAASAHRALAVIYEGEVKRLAGECPRARGDLPKFERWLPN